MLAVKQAETLILKLVQPLDEQRDGETVDLLGAAGRILSRPITSRLDFPHWDNSSMDGYAVRFADVKLATATKPITLEVVEEIPTGYQPQKTIRRGQAARILTGSMMPAGADSVVIQEQTKRKGKQVAILSAPAEPGDNVRRQGTFYQAGTTLLPPGLRLQAPELAVLAAAQCSQVTVYRRPRVAILSTGNELVAPDQPLRPGQIVDSNQYALAILITQAGAEPVRMGIVPDEPEALRMAITKAIATADVVLSSGGVSVGDYDYVEQILAELEAKIHIRAVAVKPGKPLTVATFPASVSNMERPVLYFGLPGNPVSALVTFWRFVQPALRKLSGLSDNWEPEFLQARTLHDLRSDGKRETYLWGQVHLIMGTYRFHLAGGSYSSGNLINLAQTNCLAILPIGQTFIPAGDPVQVLPISSRR